MPVRYTIRFVTTMLIAVAGCTGDILNGSPGQLEPQATDPAPTTESSMQVLTFADRSDARAGEVVKVWCLLKSGTEFFYPDAASVTITPEPAEVIASSHGATFVATGVGTYTASCATPDRIIDREGLRVDISAGLAAAWDASLTEQDCFSASDRLVVDVAVFDLYGNEVYDAPVTAVIEPSDNVAGDLDHGLRFLADGEYQVTIDVDEQDPASTIVPLQTTVHADATPPVITVETPARGAMIESSASQVTVTGTVHDSHSAIVDLRVADHDVNVSGGKLDEVFNVSATTRLGMSVITARAQDECGNVGYVAQSVLRSPDYFPAATSANAAYRVPAAFTAQLNQTFADDGDRTDVDDLATLAERVVGSYDFNTMLPAGSLLVHKDPRDCNGCPFGPIHFSAGVDAWRHPNAGRQINLSPPQIRNLDFVAGGLQFGARFENFDFPMRVRVTARECDLGCDYDHEITVDAWVGLDRLDISGTIGANLATGEADASMTNAQFNIQGAYLDIDCGVLDWACDEVTDLLIDRATGMLEDAAAAAITDMVPPLLEETLESVQLSPQLQLPAPINATLGVNAALDSLAFCGPNVGLPVPAACNAENSNPGSVALGLAAQVYPGTRGANIPAGARGPIELGGTAPSFDSSSSFAIAAKTDALNQLLWALWYSGGLNLPDLGELLGPDSSLDGSLYAGLPPVIMPGTAGNLVDIGIGDLQMDASVDVSAMLGTDDPSFVTISMTISAVVGAAVEFDAAKGSVWLIPDQEPEIYFEIHQINDLAYGQLLGEALGALMARELPEMLRDMVAELPLPTIEVGTMPGVPAGTVWSLADADLAYADGAIAFRGTLQSGAQ